MCLSPDSPAPKAAPARRRRVWELETAYHCMILGTCLAVEDLRKVAAKAGLRLAPDAVDFHVHGRLVHEMAAGGAAAKLVQKLLDARFRAHIRRCAPLAEEAELRAYWDEHAERGEFAGPFWALMTHPEAARTLKVTLFGEVHMLSHLEGATNRAFQRRLAALEREAREAGEDAARARRRLAGQRDGIDRLRARIDALEAENRRLAAAAAARRARGDSGADLRAVEVRAAEFERLADDRARRLAERTAELREREDEADALRRSLAAAEGECESLAALVRGPAPDEAAAPPPIDLAGRGVVYVGGRAGLIDRFRSLVENANGRFIHHDGGVEDNDRALESVLGRGDVALCPVDCVSHGACQRAKRFCKRTRRTFVPLRSASLSSFADGLRRAAARPAGAS